MKKVSNCVPLIVALTLIAYPVLSDRLSDKFSFLPQLSFKLPQASRNATVWRVKPGSIYDGDTLRLLGDNRELKIRLCGIDAPEKQMPLGIEARDYLRSRMNEFIVSSIGGLPKGSTARSLVTKPNL